MNKSYQKHNAAIERTETREYTEKKKNIHRKLTIYESKYLKKK